MRPLSRDLQEFIRLLNRENVEYLIVGAWAVAFHGRPRYTGEANFISTDLLVRNKRVTNRDKYLGDIQMLERKRKK